MSRRILTWLGVVAVVAAAFVVSNSAWRFSDELADELLVPPTLPTGPTVDVVEVGDSDITLALSDGSSLPGTWGLSTSRSYGRMGLVIDSSDSTITRTYSAVEGDLGPGEATLDQLAFAGDPRRALGIEYEDVSVSTALGPMPAWFIEGERGAWLIYVHGAGGRADGMRALEVAVDQGYPVLVITYRNDPGAPSSDDGRTTWGFDEWQDVDAAIEYALAAGADEIFLMGSGVGGSAVLVTLDETRHIRSVKGAILDSPILDLAATEELRRPDAGLIGSWGRTLASWRFGVEWSRLDHVATASDVRRPVLLLHGTEDELTPIEVADAFAAAGGDNVEYHRFEDAGHGEPWNTSPRRYELLLTEFLVEHSSEPG